MRFIKLNKLDGSDVLVSISHIRSFHQHKSGTRENSDVVMDGDKFRVHEKIEDIVTMLENTKDMIVSKAQ